VAEFFDVAVLRLLPESVQKCSQYIRAIEFHIARFWLHSVTVQSAVMYQSLDYLKHSRYGRFSLPLSTTEFAP
jgi:hypothetical protein